MKLSLLDINDVASISFGHKGDIGPGDVSYVYEINRCGMCGTYWEEHTKSCSRDRFKELYLRLAYRLRGFHRKFDDFFRMTSMNNAGESQAKETPATRSEGYKGKEIGVSADGLKEEKKDGFSLVSGGTISGIFYSPEDLNPHFHRVTEAELAATKNTHLTIRPVLVSTVSSAAVNPNTIETAWEAEHR